VELHPGKISAGGGIPRASLFVYESHFRHLYRSAGPHPTRRKGRIFTSLCIYAL